ncbi:MAG: class D beta-lactamase [Bacteroidota bacterium]
MNFVSNSFLKKQWLLWGLPVLFYLACNPSDTKTEIADNEPLKENGISEGEFKLLFRMQKAVGTLVIFDPQENEFYIHNEPRANQSFLPASTFRIANSLVALETGVLGNEQEIIPWDGYDRNKKAWNRDHNLSSALKASAVWVFKDLARKVGKGRMQYWVRRMNYGNHDTGGNLDKFWTSGQLRITAVEQVDFLRRLYFNRLDITDTSMNMVKKIMIKEKKGDYTLANQLGWVPKSDPAIGWNVGYVEKGEKVYFYALNINAKNKKDLENRETLVRKAFNLMGVSPG